MASPNKSDPLWLGKDYAAAQEMFVRARAEGLPIKRCLALANIASFADCWALNTTIGEYAGCSGRTVTRSMRDARSLGWFGSRRGRAGETPTGSTKPLSRRFEMRWVVARGVLGEQARARIAASRLRWIQKEAERVEKIRQRDRARWPAPDAAAAVPAKPAAPTTPTRTRRTVEEAQAELKNIFASVLAHRDKKPPSPD